MLELVVKNKTQGLLETNITELEKFVAEKLKEYDPALYNGDASSAKKDRAELNNSKKALSQARINLVRELMKPYQDFETRCKKLESDIDFASSKLDAIVKVKENEEKARKRMRCEEIWLSKNFSLFTIDKVFNPKWLNKSAKEEEISAEMNTIIERTYKDLKLIERFSEDADTLKALYLETLDIELTLGRGEELEKNRKKIAEEKETRDDREYDEKLQQQKKEVLENRKHDIENADVDDLVGEIFADSKPKEVRNEYVMTLRCTTEELKNLKELLASNGFAYESIEELKF